VGNDGFPPGPWTPELLSEAISQIDSNRLGVDLRTVQLWFQENDRGISTANIRWLARIWGCDDPVATGEWQMELSAAQSRLTAKRREAKRAANGVALAIPEMPRTATFDDEAEHSEEVARGTDEKRSSSQRSSLARKSEALFCQGFPLNLPASVFAGITALGFLSYISGIHSVTYGRADGIVKQVGFLWAANWTFVFMVFLPLFFAWATELVTFWKDEGRPTLLVQGGKLESDNAWARIIEASSYSYWAVLLICVVFAGLFQWIGVSLIPLIKGSGNYATDWGSLAIVRPEVISVPMAVVFTGCAYLYMCLCFYLFFVGLILLHTVAHDLWKFGETLKKLPDVECLCQLNDTKRIVMRGIFRCTVLGLLIAIFMKVQSAYLTSRGENVVIWLLSDMYSTFYGYNDVNSAYNYRRPTHYSSLIVTICTVFVFTYGSARLDAERGFHMPVWKMRTVIALLVAGYLLIDAFTGFSLILGIGVLLAMYGLIDPGFGRGERVS
jgi:hypothetical protein